MKTWMRGVLELKTRSSCNLTKQRRSNTETTLLLAFTTVVAEEEREEETVAAKEAKSSPKRSATVEWAMKLSTPTSVILFPKVRPLFT